MGTDKMVELVRMQISDNAKWNVLTIGQTVKTSSNIKAGAR